MIESFSPTEFWIDPGRPELFDEESHRKWTTFQGVIKKSKIPVAVNGMFNYIETLLSEGQMYMGGGMKYMFWFKTLEDRNAMIDEIAAVMPSHWKRYLETYGSNK